MRSAFRPARSFRARTAHGLRSDQRAAAARGASFGAQPRRSRDFAASTQARKSRWSTRDEDGEAMTVKSIVGLLWALASLPWAPGRRRTLSRRQRRAHIRASLHDGQTRQRDLRGLRSRRVAGRQFENAYGPDGRRQRLVLTSLRRQGELVKAGDVVAEFDTTEQNFKLREAEADLAEADQKVIQAEAQMQAKEEEDNYLLIKARADLKLAELEVRKNPLVSVIAPSRRIWHRSRARNAGAARSAIWRIASDIAGRRANSGSRTRQGQGPGRNRAQEYRDDDSARAQRRLRQRAEQHEHQHVFPGCTCRCCN